MYDIRDVLQRGIEIAAKRKTLYEKAKENEPDLRNQMIYNMMIRALERDETYYKQIMLSISDAMAEAIDFGIYDKISSLVNQFMRTLIPPSSHDRKEIVGYIIEQEKSIYALAIDIQGRMVTDDLTSMTIAYYVMTEIIEDKKQLIDKFEQLVR
ncbi:hypothetical protein [Fusibacter tunisiensis]|uniref:Uncharacterized protein n=1 Tax=Fusibacter tunisiensis TaxID=1008308 RepID=A0ABS2MT09_9FIRM|nr:hypothetical protein [Fusibacter tunisiensis]MBM7562534.1 hypothetical protein [Fusibacter tunisiensis]